VSPYRDSGRGSFVIDRVVPGVGRIKRASGTTDRATYKRLVSMVDTLKAKGRLDLLEGMRDGLVTPLQLWGAFRRGDLDRLPSAETVAPLWSKDDRGAVDRWLAAWTKSTHHRRATASSFAQLRKLATADACVGDLSALLKRYRVQCERAGFGTSFNNARSHAQAFLRDTVGRSHRLWRDCANLQRLPVTRREGRPLSVAAFDALCDQLTGVGSAHADIVRGMAGTGMGPGEFWGRWEDKGAFLRVHGAKREGRNRLVPKLWPVSRPARHPRTFADTLGCVTGGTTEPYDLRRTFAHWLEEAGVPRTRRKLYIGHGAGDVTDLYERHEVDAFLVRDGELLKAYVAAERVKATQAADSGQGEQPGPTIGNTTAPVAEGRVEIETC